MPKIKPVATKADKVIELAHSKRDKVLDKLRSRMQRHHDLWKIEPYKSKPGYRSYTTIAPLAHFNETMHGIIRSGLSWQIKLTEEELDDEDTREKTALGESLLYACVQSADKDAVWRGESPVKETLGALGLLRGWAAGLCLMYVDEETDKFTCDIQVVDPMHVTYEMGRDGLIWWAYEYPISKGQALNEYGKKIAGDIRDDERDHPTTIINFFDRVNNCIVLTGSQTFIKRPTPHGLGRVPCFINSAGSLPTLYTKDYGSTLEHRGDGLYKASEHVFTHVSEEISFLKDMRQRHVKSVTVLHSDGGEKTLEDDPWKEGSHITLDPLKHETLDVLEPAKPPAETNGLLSFYMAELQSVSIARIGADPAGHSGSALAEIRENELSNYSVYTNLIQNFYSWLFKELFLQFSDKGVSNEFVGYNGEGDFFRTTIRPDDIDDSWIVEVKCEPSFPRDDEADMNLAILARTGGVDGRPMYDDRTIHERFLNTQNVDAVDKRITEQIVTNMPAIQLYEQAKTFVEQGRPDWARVVALGFPDKDMGAFVASELGLGPPPLPPPPPEVLAIAQRIMEQQQAQQQGGGMPQQGGAPPMGGGQPMGGMPQQAPPF